MNQRLIQNGLLALWSLVLLTSSWALFTRHNQFPYHYHPDEPGKVEQVLSQKYNFNHPVLLLSTTRLALAMSAQPANEQRVVEIGRGVSALFMAVAVVSLALVGFLWRGWPGTLTAGLVLLLHHQLYELAHYMKEDSAMLMGLALTFLATTMFWQSPSRWRALFLGLACALAISGKYLGIVSLLIALPVLCKRRTPGSVLAFSLALVITFAVVNLPLLANLATFEQSLGREMNFVVNGQKGMTRSVPHAQYWSIFLDNSTPALWLLLGIFLSARWREWRAITAAEWGLIAFPFAYALVLSFSPKSNDRYFLPASAVLALLAVLGIEDAAHLLSGRLRRGVVLVMAALLLIGLQLSGWSQSHPGLAQYEDAFQHDDLDELIQWIRAELPADAVIAKDNRVNLPDPNRKKHAARMGVILQKVVAARFAADLGTLSEMRAKGITHVIVSESDYGKFFLTSLRPQAEELAGFERRKAFYEDLFRQGELLWERERGTVIYLHPGLRVYRLSRAVDLLPVATGLGASLKPGELLEKR